MIIAQQKRKENIAEYILYMWQIEDIIRAHNFDLIQIEENIISKFDLTDEEYNAMKDWYDNLIQHMINDGVAEKGHIKVLENLVAELEELHIALLRSPYHSDYVKVYQEALPYLSEYVQKVKDKNKSVVELSLEFLYGILLLKLKKQKISPQTQEAFEKIRNFIAMLSQKFKQYETDEDFYK